MSKTYQSARIIRIALSSLSVGSLSVGSLSVGAFASACTQPEITCSSARGSFAAKYALRDGAGECATLIGDTIGIQSYNPTAAGRTTSDLKHTDIAIKPQALGDLVARAGDASLSDATPEDHPYAFGGFTTSNPTDEGFCTALDLEPARQQLPELPAIPGDATSGTTEVPAVPATSIEYTWSDVHFYVTPAAPGTQMTATLKYKRDDCEATYDVRALYPAVPCANAAGAPDDANCSAEADPEHGRATGSGISPDFRTTCDPQLLLCVLADGPLPVLTAKAAEANGLQPYANDTR